MGYTAKKLIAIAKAEIGYLEKETNKNLDSKTGNAGDENYTKYARDLNDAGYYNGNKNGYAWCDVFHDYCHWIAAGKDAKEAQRVICQTGDLGAGCKYSAQYYENAGRLYKTPKAGDTIFFYNAKKTSIAHTGIVTAVDDTYVYTVEGNTSGASGVVANGGGVCEKKYKLTYDRIYGYGRPLYDAEVVKESKGYSPAVKEWQKAAIADGYKFPKYGADGVWGDECVTVARSATVKKRATYTNKNLTKIVQKAVGVTADGLCGKNTDAAIKAFQRKHGLKADGIVGERTWRCILNIR